MVFLIQTDLPGWQMASAMSHAIHKIVSKRRCQSYFISRRSPHHGISKDSDLCASAHRCPHYAYARLIARVTFKLVWCKNSKNNEFRTKKFLNQEFLYGISSFCTLTENNCFLYGKISCFCIFLAKNGVFNTNRTPRAADGNAALRAMHSIHKCVAKDAPHLLTALRNEPRYS